MMIKTKMENWMNNSTIVGNWMNVRFYKFVRILNWQRIVV